MGIVADAVSQVIQSSPQDIEPAPAFGTSVRLELPRGHGEAGHEVRAHPRTWTAVFAADDPVVSLAAPWCRRPARRRACRCREPVRSVFRRSPPLGPQRRAVREVRELIYREAGIALTDSKKSLLVSRVAGRLRELGLASFGEYYDLVVIRRPATSAAGCSIASAPTRRSFFRDPRQFLFLNDDVFPRLEAEARRAGRSACARGARPARPARSRIRWRWRCSTGSPRRRAGRSRSSRPICRTRCLPPRARRCGRSTRRRHPAALSQGVHAARHRQSDREDESRAGDSRGRVVLAHEPQRSDLLGRAGCSTSSSAATC